MRENKMGYVELVRIIMARSMNVPPDNIDMSSIFGCVQRAIEEKVENNLSEDEVTLSPSSQREINAVISEMGETIIPMMFHGEYPFGNFVKDYEKWYDDNLAAQFLKMKLQAMSDEKRS